ncbi:hypothetical protein Scep_019214 [Stephania cephalantha]|uniref:Uncharacterized protein n=1 Tax=Stephania cephalantha TaxID=152367 RepID=A0AAP0IAI0_9MAGN
MKVSFVILFLVALMTATQVIVVFGRSLEHHLAQTNSCFDCDKCPKTGYYYGVPGKPYKSACC